MDIDEAKRAIRAEVRRSRSARSPADRVQLSTQFEDMVLDTLQRFSPRRVAAFLPLQTEPPITALLHRLLESGVHVSVPVSQGEGAMTWHELTADTLVDPGSDAEGMPVPRHLVAANDMPDVILIPAAAADTQGNRLGWGKGYYDRYLATVAVGTPVIAVVFDDEVRTDIPVEPHDQPATHVVTQSRVFTV